MSPFQCISALSSKKQSEHFMISKMEFTATVLILCLYKYISSQFCICLIVACPQAQISSLKTLRFMVNPFVYQLFWRVVRYYRLQLRSRLPNAHLLILLYVDRDLRCKQHVFKCTRCRLKLKSVKTIRQYDYLLTVTRAEVSQKPWAINLDIIISFRPIVFRKKKLQ